MGKLSLFVLRYTYVKAVEQEVNKEEGEEEVYGQRKTVQFYCPHRTKAMQFIMF